MGTPTQYDMADIDISIAENDEYELDVAEYDEYEPAEIEIGEQPKENEKMYSSLQMQLNEYSKYPLLSEAEEQQLLREYHDTHNPEIRDKLVQANLRLVINKAFKAKLYVGRHIDERDLIQDGAYGLIKAIDRFDPSKGCRLSTYAVNWISQSISKGCKDFLAGNAVTLPDTAAYNMRKIQKYIISYENREHRQPSLEEIARGTGLRSKQVKDIMPWIGGVSSLNYVINDDDDENKELESIYNSDSTTEDTTLESVASIELTEILIKGAEKCLTPKESAIISSLYGIGGAQTKDIGELSTEYKVTKERIRQIVKQACMKMRKAKDIGALASYLK